MSRRGAVRVTLFARARLTGAGRAVRCAVTDVSAGGARLSLSGEVPPPPLRLELELGGEQLAFDVELSRVLDQGGVAVTFPRPHSDRLHRLLADEQRRALAQGRANISERRLPPAFRGGPAFRRGPADAAPRPEDAAPPPEHPPGAGQPGRRSSDE
jgi:hypothetical protein